MLIQLKADERKHHSSDSIAKMSANIPLDDADRWDWLIRLREAAIEALEDGGNVGVVMTCSALKRKYRDVIRIATLDACSVRLHFLYLDASLYTLKMRLHARKGHYMSSSMIESQLRDLEPIGKGETDVIRVDVNGSQNDNRNLITATMNSILRTR
jgi:gluconokinase